ncbi:hypothetical protein [Methylobacterium planeticum]|uniref:Porin n=1 Tax=Methylobacterium planeticum TaxID=2615211 RepID=A0A6N6MLV4_9HYPH|nr:hypothetical protein [Methylobacterium planeticum]KAB1072276.1 hypothetical protein F6X51_16325 [Methylobacterium planeticum]
MHVRSASAAALVALSLGALAAPARAGEANTFDASTVDASTFDAWGHRFQVPGTQRGLARSATPSRDVGSTGSVAVPSGYTSGGSAAASAPVEARRTLNVWGARIDAPAR